MLRKNYQTPRNNQECNYNNNYNFSNDKYDDIIEAYNGEVLHKIITKDRQYRMLDKELEPYEKFKTNLYYGQTRPEDFGYNFFDDRYRHYSPHRFDYLDSKYGDHTYNYYLNAPMRGDRSEDWKYPPQYYYCQRYDPIKKIYTN